MIRALRAGVNYDEEGKTVIFIESSVDCEPILHLLDYAEEEDPYQSWEETIARFLPMLDRSLIPSLTFRRESAKGGL